MPATTTQSCYDIVILQRLLAEQLSGDEEAAVLNHIEDCGACRDTMARLAGGGELVDDIKHHLADHGVSDQGLETVLESDLVEAEVEQLRSILGPTDDPHMMGRLGTYEVVSIIGRGSTGIVFKALDRGLNRFVAIKMLVPSFATNGPARERFAREGRSIASVRDQHVVQVFAVSEQKGLPFIVMEYLPTGSLAQRITREGTLQTIEVARIGMQIATALAAAHKQGIVHRDVKPANVLLANGVNRALVTDFGLARLLDEASMTHSGAISGTPQFMSPEQAQGSTVDHRSDLFSLGSVLYAACTGHSPFRSETIFGVIKRVCEAAPRPISEVNPQIEGWLCDFIEKLHSKHPDNRFQSAEAVAEYLEAELAHMQAPSTISQPQRPWQTIATNDVEKRSRVKQVSIGICTITISLLAGMGTGLLESQNQNSDVSPLVTGAPLGPLRQYTTVMSIETEQAGRMTISRDARNLPMETDRRADVCIVLADPSSWHSMEDCKDAEMKYRALLEQYPNSELTTLNLALALHYQGNLEEALSWHQRTAASDCYQELGLYNIACYHSLNGNSDLAFQYLQKSIEAGYTNIQHILADNDLAPIRKDTRFADILMLATKAAESDNECCT